VIQKTAMARSCTKKTIIFLIAAILSACASAPVNQIDLMPAPDVYGDGLLNPLPEYNPFDEIPYDGILFGSDRAPATEEDPEQYYRNDRGQVVRLGLAEIQFGKKEFTWQFAGAGPTKQAGRETTARDPGRYRHYQYETAVTG